MDKVVKENIRLHEKEAEDYETKQREIFNKKEQERVNHPSQIFGFGRGLKKLLWRGGRLA